MHDLKTILVIEDEPLLLEYVVDLLSAFGYRVLSASPTEEALHYLKDSVCQIDLMFSDIRIPGGMNGLALQKPYMPDDLIATIRTALEQGPSCMTRRKDGHDEFD